MLSTATSGSNSRLWKSDFAAAAAYSAFKAHRDEKSKTTTWSARSLLRDCNCMSYDPWWCALDRHERESTFTAFFATGTGGFAQYSEAAARTRQPASRPSDAEIAKYRFKVYPHSQFRPPSSGRLYADRPNNLRIEDISAASVKKDGGEASCGRIPVSFAWGHVTRQNGTAAAPGTVTRRSLMMRSGRDMNHEGSDADGRIHSDGPGERRERRRRRASAGGGRDGIRRDGGPDASGAVASHGDDDPEQQQRASAFGLENDTTLGWLTFPLTNRWPMKRHILQHPCVPFASSPVPAAITSLSVQCVTVWGQHDDRQLAELGQRVGGFESERSDWRQGIKMPDPIWEVDLEECLASARAPVLISGSSHQEAILRHALFPYLFPPGSYKALSSAAQRHVNRAGEDRGSFVGFGYGGESEIMIDSPSDGPAGVQQVVRWSWNPHLEPKRTMLTLANSLASMTREPKGAKEEEDDEENGDRLLGRSPRTLYHLQGRGPKELLELDYPLDLFYREMVDVLEANPAVASFWRNRNRSAALRSERSHPPVGDDDNSSSTISVQSILWLLQTFHGRPMDDPLVPDPCSEWGRQDLFRELNYCAAASVNQRSSRKATRQNHNARRDVVFYDPGPMTRDPYSATWTDWDGSHYLGHVPRMMAVQLFHYACRDAAWSSPRRQHHNDNKGSGRHHAGNVAAEVQDRGGGPPNRQRLPPTEQQRGASRRRQFRGGETRRDNDDPRTHGSVLSGEGEAENAEAADDLNWFLRDPRNSNGSEMILCGCRERCDATLRRPASHASTSAVSAAEHQRPLANFADLISRWKRLSQAARTARNETKPRRRWD